MHDFPTKSVRGSIAALGGRALFTIALTTLSAQYAGAQTAAPKGSSLPPQQISGQTAPAANADGGTDNRLGELRNAANQFSAVHEKLEGDSRAEFDILLRSKPCQINRMDALFTRLVAALNTWNDAELKYWAAWGDAEADRVEGRQKNFVSMQAEQKRAEDLLASTQKDRESLLRDEANLEKFGARTDAIRKPIDSLIQDVKESEARLDQAQKKL